jgi:hypothetical protein
MSMSAVSDNYPLPISTKNARVNMHKKLTIELVDGSAPVAGVKVKVTGCAELETAAPGAVFFLVTEAQVSVTVAGTEIHALSLDALPPKLRFAKDGGGWKLV